MIRRRQPDAPLLHRTPARVGQWNLPTAQGPSTGRHARQHPYMADERARRWAIAAGVLAAIATLAAVYGVVRVSVLLFRP